ncbi:MAG: GAF domain-containing protein [Polyangiaceae bacterium]|nr:GAF domain-containing protein [Polyangiaceae bacterium]
MADQGGQEPIDVPVDDLKRERDAFIQQFFRKGAQLTEELLKENERLRDKVADLEAENSKLAAHLASDTAIRDLLRKIDQLEQEKQDLLKRHARVQADTSRIDVDYREIESELANLANLYVAATQLHSARTVRTCIRNLKELLAQFCGAAEFAVYFVSDDKTELLAIASEGVHPDQVARVPLTDGPLAEVFRSGRLQLGSSPDTSKGTLQDPAAIVPMQLDGRTVGIIAIFGTLPQKTELINVDYELFKLLGAQAAPALVNARLFADAGRKVPSVQAFVAAED